MNIGQWGGGGNSETLYILIWKMQKKREIGEVGKNSRHGKKTMTARKSGGREWGEGGEGGGKGGRGRRGDGEAQQGQLL